MDLASKSLLLIVPLVLLVFTDVEAAANITTAATTAVTAAAAAKSTAKPAVAITKASAKAAAAAPATGNSTIYKGNNSATRVYGITATLMTMMVLTISL